MHYSPAHTASSKHYDSLGDVATLESVKAQRDSLALLKTGQLTQEQRDAFLQQITAWMAARRQYEQTKEKLIAEQVNRLKPALQVAGLFGDALLKELNKRAEEAVMKIIGPPPPRPELIPAGNPALVAKLIKTATVVPAGGPVVVPQFSTMQQPPADAADADDKKKSSFPLVPVLALAGVAALVLVMRKRG